MRPRLQATIAALVTTVLWLWHHTPLPAALAIIATTLALLAWISPARYAPISGALEKFAHAILVAFTWLSLGLIYFGVFAPIRLWRALNGNDPLHRRFDPRATTYLHSLPPTPPNFTRQF
jgi:hypothetical protein